MILKDLFTSLGHAELNAHVTGLSGFDGSCNSFTSRMTTLVNQTLKELYSKYLLKEDYIIVQAIDAKVTYPLRVEFASTNTSSAETKYILDTPNKPFIGDIAKILKVTNEVNQELPLNDYNNHMSVFTPTYDVLQLPHNCCDQIYNVYYQATHYVLKIDEDDDETLNQVIHIPPVLEDALRIRVAQKIYSAMSGQDSTNKAQELLLLYNQLCSEVDNRNLANLSNVVSNIKLDKRGFV